MQLPRSLWAGAGLWRGGVGLSSRATALLSRDPQHRATLWKVTSCPKPRALPLMCCSWLHGAGGQATGRWVSGGGSGQRGSAGRPISAPRTFLFASGWGFLAGGGCQGGFGQEVDRHAGQGCARTCTRASRGCRPAAAGLTGSDTVHVSLHCVGVAVPSQTCRRGGWGVPGVACPVLEPLTSPRLCLFSAEGGTLGGAVPLLAAFPLVP